jgi:hypothetical protein
MGSAVQIHENKERRGTWPANSINPWYLQTLPEHYWCHKIHVKGTRSKKISGTIFQDKVHHPTHPHPSRHNDQSTQQPHTSIERENNAKGLEQIKAIKKLDKLLNNSPQTVPEMRTITPQETKRVMIDKTTKPPQESDPSPRVRMPTQRTQTTAPITTATINKPITKIPPPRVQNAQPATPSMKRDNVTPTWNKETLRDHLRSKKMARILHCNILLQQQTSHQKQAQLIHNREAGQFLGHQQLLRNPKHKDLWAKSAANEFRR